jgi:hypothetical protein
MRATVTDTGPCSRRKGDSYVWSNVMRPKWNKSGAPLSVSDEMKLMRCDCAARWLAEHDAKLRGSKKIRPTRRAKQGGKHDKRTIAS